MNRRICVAVLCCAFSLTATAQERDRAMAQVQVGLERALKIPLELVLLRAAVWADAWRNDSRLATGLPPCSSIGAAMEGCSVMVLPDRKHRIILAALERTSLAASFSSPLRCDLPPG